MFSWLLYNTLHQLFSLVMGPQNRAFQWEQIQKGFALVCIWLTTPVISTDTIKFKYLLRCFAKASFGIVKPIHTGRGKLNRVKIVSLFFIKLLCPWCLLPTWSHKLVLVIPQVFNVQNKCKHLFFPCTGITRNWSGFSKKEERWGWDSDFS